MDAVLNCTRSHFAILYQRCSSDLHYRTSVWVIEDPLVFHDIKHQRPWARRIHCLEARFYWFEPSCCPLSFGLEGYLYCPSGKVSLREGVRKQLRADKAYDVSENDQDYRYAFSGDGQQLVRLCSDQKSMVCIPWLEIESGVTVYDLITSMEQGREGINSHYRLSAVSQTGRFIVYTYTCEVKDIRCSYLLDTSKNIQGQRLPEIPGETRFFFTVDETCLLQICSSEDDQ